jgi:dipeptidase E
MLHIVAIGGGELGTGETEPLDRQIVQATGKDRPSALFIPTASGDSLDYCQTFRRVYGDLLGCRVDALLLSREQTDAARIEAAIAGADLIYVGGGNTRRMLEVWRSRGVDAALVRAGQRGVVLSGLSAGAICWFRRGNSDAPSMEGADANARKTACVDGLGLIDATGCPHMDSEPYRRSEFPEMLRELPGVGLGLDDGVALEVLGEQYRVHSLHPQAAAYRIRWRDGARVDDRLAAHEDLRPLQDLLHPDEDHGRSR